jgi:predicted secreted acid phosphatase
MPFRFAILVLAIASSFFAGATNLAMAKNSERMKTSLPAPVMLDLDEIVLDNGWCQSSQYD